MSDLAPATVVALVTHARSVSAPERERFAARMRDAWDDRSMIIETCHRVEAYLVPQPGDAVPSDRLPDGGRLLTGEAAVRHAIAVAVGRDSVVVSEDQVLHQLRESVETARDGGGLDPVLERLFAVSLRAGRRARSWRVGPVRSLADVAIAAIERRSGPVRGREILVVGAGKMGRLAVRSAAAHGAVVSIANRSTGRASAVAAETGARIEAFDPGPTIDRFAAIVVALGGPWAIGRPALDALTAASTIVVDLSVPGAVPASAVQGPTGWLISADDLALTDAQPVVPGDRTMARLDALIDETTAEFLSWLERRDARAAAAALTARADLERDAELDRLWRLMPELDDDARDAIERMSRHLVQRVLREPLERLGRDTDGRQERAARELFGL